MSREATGGGGSSSAAAEVDPYTPGTRADDAGWPNVAAGPNITADERAYRQGA